MASVTVCLLIFEEVVVKMSAGTVLCVGQIRLAEVEQVSLMSEQLSDKSSSPALPDDLSLDENGSYQLLEGRSKVMKNHSNIFRHR